MIVKRSRACARCASERVVSDVGAITNNLPLANESKDDLLSESISDATQNYQEITTWNFVIYTIWGEPQLRQDLFKLVADLADEIVTLEYAVDWIVLMVGEQLPATEEQLRKLNVAPLIHFVEVYIGNGVEPQPPVKAQVVQVTLNAQAVVKGALTLEIPAGLSRTEIEQRALSRLGEVSWVYNGTIDGTEQVEGMEQTGQVFGLGDGNAC